MQMREIDARRYLLTTLVDKNRAKCHMTIYKDTASVSAGVKLWMQRTHLEAHYGFAHSRLLLRPITTNPHGLVLPVHLLSLINI